MEYNRLFIEDSQVMSIDDLNNSLNNFWDKRSEELLKHQRYWFNKMCENRLKMKLPPLEFNDSNNYIPKSIRRDVTGIPIYQLPEG